MHPIRLIPLLGLLACGSDPAPSDLTYYKDAKVILDAKCASCHQPGDIGPFSLTEYEQVVAFDAAVRSSIDNGTMPPWQPSDDCTDYVGNIDLTDAERQLLLEWLDAGAPEGDPADAPESAPDAGPSWEGQLKLQLPEPYTPQGEPDDYRCQLIPWPEEQTTYVTGLRVIPDQRAIVHHTIAFLVTPDQVEQYLAYDAAEEGPGYTCFGGPTAGSDGGILDGVDPAEVLEALETLGLSLADLTAGTLSAEDMLALFQELGVSGSPGGFATLGSWVPGAADLPLPAGTGIKVEPGSMLAVQMHYNTQTAAPVADQSRLEIAIAETVEREAMNLPVVDLGWLSDGRMGEAMTIPAGESAVTHSTSVSYDSLFVQMALRNLGLPSDSPLVIHSANHHMHELGTSQVSVVAHEDGTESCLLDLPDWDFNWQGSYQLTQPVVLGPGDSIDMACTWDNSAANQPVVDGQVREPADVSWGEGTSDEMCLGFLYVTAP